MEEGAYQGKNHIWVDVVGTVTIEEEGGEERKERRYRSICTKAKVSTVTLGHL